MRIVVISDTHNRHRKLEIPSCDLLIHCGDYSLSGLQYEFEEFISWFGAQDSLNKILVPGNHDGFVQKKEKHARRSCEHQCVDLLIDQEIEVEGLKIYGFPWTPTYGMWAFMLDDLGMSMENRVAKIPKNLDILVSHGPPYMILDKTRKNSHAGSLSLIRALENAKPKHHVFGHIHEDYGTVSTSWGGKAYNCAVLNRHYELQNKPIIIDL